MQIFFNTGNGNAIFGRQHYNAKNRWIIAGTGHNTNAGRAECGVAFGQWSDITPASMFVIGNGSSNDDRKNIIEVVADNGGTVKANNIEVEDATIKIKNIIELAPSVVSSNYTLSGGAILQDYSGTQGFRFVDTSGTSSYATGQTNTIIHVKPGDVLEWSFSARKSAEDVTGKLYFNLMKCSATGGNTSNNYVQNAAASTYSTDWETFSGSFTVPSDTEYIRIRFGRSNNGAGSNSFYEVKDVSVKRKTDSGIFLESPNGTRYKLSVADDGTLTTVLV